MFRTSNGRKEAQGTELGWQGTGILIDHRMSDLVARGKTPEQSMCSKLEKKMRQERNYQCDWYSSHALYRRQSTSQLRSRQYSKEALQSLQRLNGLWWHPDRLSTFRLVPLVLLDRSRRLSPFLKTKDESFLTNRWIRRMQTQKTSWEGVQKLWREVGQWIQVAWPDARMNLKETSLLNIM